jgi:hypothetical protein
MARAMRASGERNPTATRVISRILVLTDSMRPFDSPCSIATRIEALCLTMRRCRSTKGGDPAAAGPADPDFEGFFGLIGRELEDQSETFLEQIGTVQPGVGLGDPGQLGLLRGGQVLGVLPQRDPGVLERLRLTTGPPGPAPGEGATGLVPRLAADLVERVGGPADDMGGIGTADFPCSRLFTRRDSASSRTWTVPRSSARHRRRPSPRSKAGDLRWHRPHRPRARFPGRTSATSTCSSSSNSISSTTVFSTPSRARQKLAFCTPFSALWLMDLDSPKT